MSTPLPKTLKGLSAYVAFGAWGRPTIHRFKDVAGLRVCLGFVAVAVVRSDIEALLAVGAHACGELNEVARG